MSSNTPKSTQGQHSDATAYESSAASVHAALAEICYVPQPIQDRINSKVHTEPGKWDFADRNTGRSGQHSVKDTSEGQRWEGTWQEAKQGDNQNSGTWAVNTIRNPDSTFHPIRGEFSLTSKDGSTKGLVTDGQENPEKLVEHRPTPFGPVWVKPEGHTHALEEQGKIGAIRESDAGEEGAFTWKGGQYEWTSRSGGPWTATFRSCFNHIKPGEFCTCAGSVFKQRTTARGDQPWEPTPY